MTNKQIKEIISLRDKSKFRKESRRFIVEGLKMYVEASQEDIEQIIVTKEFGMAHEALLKDVEHEIIDNALMSRLSDTKTPQGIMCVLRQRAYELSQIVSVGSLFLILEDIQDPGNLGTIFRTAEGAGVSAIIMTRGCVDIYNPKTIRSTMGSIYRVPFAYTDDIEEAISVIKSMGIEIYAAHLKADRYYDEVKYRRSAFLIGNEGNGLKEETSKMADEHIKIPMQGDVESLNVSIATSILMYEHQRQKRQEIVKN